MGLLSIGTAIVLCGPPNGTAMMGFRVVAMTLPWITIMDLHELPRGSHGVDLHELPRGSHGKAMSLPYFFPGVHAFMNRSRQHCTWWQPKNTKIVTAVNRVR